MDKNDLICVTGANGLVGSAILRKLNSDGFTNVFSITREFCDLSDKLALVKLRQNFGKPKYIFHAASMVGGIGKNINYPADFGLVNSKINNTVIEWAKIVDAKLLFLGSSCIYPRDCPQPMKEEYLLTGHCEPTNEMYALSKIYGIKLCQAFRKQYGCNFITCQPSNIYGEGDHFDENAHVVGSLINKFHLGKFKDTPVILWGDGSAMRELLYVDDISDACVFLMKNYDGEELINVGTGEDITIKDLSEKIKNIIGYKKEIEWDTSKPNGMPRKVLDVSNIHKLGWKHNIDLNTGLEKTYKWYLENVI